MQVLLAQRCPSGKKSPDSSILSIQRSKHKGTSPTAIGSCDAGTLTNQAVNACGMPIHRCFHQCIYPKAVAKVNERQELVRCTRCCMSVT